MAGRKLNKFDYIKIYLRTNISTSIKTRTKKSILYNHYRAWAKNFPNVIPVGSDFFYKVISSIYGKKKYIWRYLEIVGPDYGIENKWSIK